MRLLPNILIAIGAGCLVLAGTPAASAATPGTVQPSLPRVEACGVGPAAARPSSVILACADDGELATQLTWSAWTRTQAVATGFVTWRACVSMCAASKRWGKARADITLSGPLPEHGQGTLFTRLELRVTGPTPAGFIRTESFSEAPVTSVRPPAAVPGVRARPQAEAPEAASGTLSYALIEGFWDDAGGPRDSVSVSGEGTFTQDQVAAAISGAESSFEPGIIQPGVDYCGSGSDRAGWGLWQITCGNSVPQFGTDFQILDPWNNAEAAVAKFNAAVSAGDNGFEPWTTFNDGAYTRFLQHTSAQLPASDPGEYTQVNSTPSGTPASPAPDPGGTFGPALPGTSGPTQIAFEANTDNLWLDTNAAGQGTNAGLGMMAGTSPAVAALSGGGYAVAFQANTGNLWVDDNGTAVNAGLGMMAGTSPAITGLPGGGYEIAFQANTGNLWTDDNGTATDQDLGMAAGTSPAIASTSSGFEVAFEANTDNLWTDLNGQGTNAGLGMMAGTSPAITGLPGGGYEIAFQANTGNLWTDDNGTATDQRLGMAAGTSPADTTES